MKRDPTLPTGGGLGGHWGHVKTALLSWPSSPIPHAKPAPLNWREAKALTGISLLLRAHKVPGGLSWLQVQETPQSKAAERKSFSLTPPSLP